jgi:hypothetical protein
MSRNANISSVGAGLGSLMLGLCLLPCLVGDARAAVAAWDQDRTTEIASGLPDAAQALYEAIYDQPAPPGPGRANWHQLRDTVRRIRMEARHLADELMKGRDRDQTRGAWRQMMEWLRDVEEASRGVMLGDDVMTKLAAVEDLLRQLAPYYDPDWDAKGKSKR